MNPHDSELGNKVYIIDEDNCKAIRKAVITKVSHHVGFVDFLSSNYTATEESKTYQVCAVKNGTHHFFNRESHQIFHSLKSVEEHFAAKAMKGFYILE